MVEHKSTLSSGSGIAALFHPCGDETRRTETRNVVVYVCVCVRGLGAGLDILSFLKSLANLTSSTTSIVELL